MTTTPINKIKSNPNNPRVIKDDKFKKLVQSLKDLPEMAQVRPIVVNQDMIVLGGNMRLKAMKEAGWKEAPVAVVDWDEDKQRQFIIKDNVGFGEWDWDMLANEWDAESLGEWGLNVPAFNEDVLTNNQDYEGLDQLSKLDKFMDSELKRMFLVYDAETFEKVVAWFAGLQEKHNLNSSSDVVLKLMENESL
jgi:ParB-like chromosome segregation protein Spo0J